MKKTSHNFKGLDIIRDAIIDNTQKYRYMLSRQWGNNKNNFVNFVMLNPSTADANVNDHTVTRCINLARNNGFDGLYITNLFALRATNPLELRNTDIDPVGKENNKYIEEYAKRSKKIVVAWGNNGDLYNRDDEVIEKLSKIKKLYCLGKTQNGQPRHPRSVRTNTKFKVYK